MTVVERAARAIVKRRFYDCEPHMYESLDAFYDELDDALFEESCDEARAAIEAMRKPTMRMVTAASEITVGYDDFACGDGTIYLSASKAPVVWQSMIDAALRESK